MGVGVGVGGCEGVYVCGCVGAILYRCTCIGGSGVYNNGA